MTKKTITMMHLRSLDPGTQNIVKKIDEIDNFKIVDGDLYILQTTEEGRKKEHIIAAGVWAEIITWKEEK